MAGYFVFCIFLCLRNYVFLSRDLKIADLSALSADEMVMKIHNGIIVLKTIPEVPGLDAAPLCQNYDVTVDISEACQQQYLLETVMN